MSGSFKAAVVASLGRASARLSRSGLWRYGRPLVRGLNLLDPQPVFTVSGVPIRLPLPLDQVGVFDVATAWDRREPEVFDWLDRLTPADVLFDVGASFGTETLYAALKPGGPREVHAFDLDLVCSHVLACALAVNRVRHVRNHVLMLAESGGLAGADYHSNKLTAGTAGRPERYDAVYRVTAMRGDDYCRAVGVRPTHLKVDVDGPEATVLRGFGEVLADPGLRSVLVEVRPESQAAVTALLTGHGFRPTGVASATDNLVFDRAG